MLNTDAVRIIAKYRDDAAVITTMTTIFTFPEVSPHNLNFRCAPLMGGASSIGLGIALARPERKVLVLDGDGSLLMQLGSLATIAEAAPRNFFHFVFENGVLYEGGGRVEVANGRGVNFQELARAAGYAATYSFDGPEEMDRVLPGVLAGPAPALIRLVITIPATPRWSNENPQGELPDWWFTMMGEDARRMATVLAG